MAPLNGAVAPWRRLLPGIGTALLLWASTPPRWFTGSEALVLPGWMAFYALLTRSNRPVRQAYWLGVLHMLLFSLSLRHVLWLGWIAVGLLGGLYYALAVVATRRLAWLGRPLAFGIALSSVHWLRANMPEIYYPHGQPCHALWQQPWLLGPVAWGGEVLANLLLGAVAAVLVELWRSWRLAETPWRPALWRAVAVPSSWLLLCIVPPPAAPAMAPVQVDIAAIEPGMHPMDPYEGLDNQQYRQRFQELFAERLLQPTRAVAGVGVQAPPDLVLWPESSMPATVDLAAPAKFDDWLRAANLQLAPEVRLCLGAGALLPSRQSDTPAAVLVDHRGHYLAHQEKLCLVPAGERLPLLGLLPDRWSDWVREYVRQSMGQVPDSAKGRMLPPLTTRKGVPFGTLICYDNAFPEVAAAHVDQGARFLCVLSNEAWYRGGGELQQLAAITVLRALETRTPIVRCTTDGISMAVLGDGRTLATLPLQPAPAVAPRTLRISLPAGPGAMPPLAWLRPVLAVAVNALLGMGILHSLLLWARLLAVRAKSTPVVGGRSPSNTGTGGS